MQQKELLEIFTDFETKNRYAIRLPEGHEVLYAAETGKGLWGTLARQFFKNRRPFELCVMNPAGGVVFTFQRR